MKENKIEEKNKDNLVRASTYQRQIAAQSVMKWQNINLSRIHKRKYWSLHPKGLKLIDRYDIDQLKWHQANKVKNTSHIQLIKLA
jgi:hypothetical protein